MRQEIIEQGEIALVPKANLKTALRKIRDNPEGGKPLVRTLQGCWSVRVGGSENRIVYRILTIENEQVVEVIAIGRRRDNEVYDTAATRI